MKNKKIILFLGCLVYLISFKCLISHAEDFEDYLEHFGKQIGHKYPLKIEIYNYLYETPCTGTKYYKIDKADSCFIIKSVINTEDIKFYEIKFNSSKKPAFITVYSVRSFYREYFEKEWEQEQFKENIKYFGNNIAQAIRNKKIFIGMTKEQVKLSWGEPKDINRTITSSGVHEQWIYHDDTYIYFDNDVLTGLQDKVK